MKKMVSMTAVSGVGVASLVGGVWACAPALSSSAAASAAIVIKEIQDPFRPRFMAAPLLLIERRRSSRRLPGL
ncbi:hypothetical protein ACVIWU_008840 [Bradyrhizobium sp. USDA 4509]